MKTSNKTSSKASKSKKESESYSVIRAKKVAQAATNRREKLVAEARVQKFDLPHNFKEYGSFDRRLIACTIDVLILALISMIYTKFIDFVLFGGKTSGQVVAEVLESVTGTAYNAGIISILKDYGIFYKILFIQLSSFFILWGYCIFSWMHMNATIGKYIMKLQIITSNNKKLSFWRCNLRFFSYIISTIIIFLGFFWIYFNKERRAWHDYIASTRVVYCPSSVLGNSPPSRK